MKYLYIEIKCIRSENVPNSMWINSNTVLVIYFLFSGDGELHRARKGKL